MDLVAVMGSVGTIGFTGDSDLDVWVCCAPAGHSSHGLSLYRRKVEEVEAWMAGHAGVEVHLFLQESARIRASDFGEADLEGCGSAMGALLKEEFYRTGILLAGKIPLWWLLPPGTSPEEHARRAAAAPAGQVDLGPVARVPLGELFGAAIWQIVKSWKSPFKSALKMGLLEKAVRSGREVPPLCELLEDEVRAGRSPDPYQLLFDEVLAHYRSQGDAEAEDLLARCFYLKTGVRLDPAGLGRGRGDSPDETLMLEYVRSWGWGARRVRHLNGFADWKFEWVQGLAKEIDRFFLRTYQRIRVALEESGEVQRITDRDLTILGRKLQAAYRRAPHKVETLHLVGGAPAEASLTLYQETQPGEAPWALFRGMVSAFNVEEKRGDLLPHLCRPPGAAGVGRAEPRARARHPALVQGRGARPASRRPGGHRAAPLRPRGGCLRRPGAPGAPPGEAPADAAPAGRQPRPRRGAAHRGGGGVDHDLGRNLLPPLGGRRRLPPLRRGLFLPSSGVPPSRSVRGLGAVRRGGSARFDGRLQREIPGLALISRWPDVPRTCAAATCGGSRRGGTSVLDRSGGGDADLPRASGDREGLLRYLSGVGPYRRSRRGSRAPRRPGRAEGRDRGGQAGMVDVFVLGRRRGRPCSSSTRSATSPLRLPAEGPRTPWQSSCSSSQQTLPDLAGQPSHTARRPAPSTRRYASTLSLRGHLPGVHLHLRADPPGPSPGAQPRASDRAMPGTAPGGRVRGHWGGQTDPQRRGGQPPRGASAPHPGGAGFGPRLRRIRDPPLPRRALRRRAPAFVTTGHYLFYKKAIEQRLSG